jgi:Tfp pilus assembly major pilin PilA
MKPATLVTIAVTGLAVLVVAGWGIPAYQGYLHRSRMTDVINELSRVRSLAAGEMLSRKPGGPAKREFKSESPMVTRIDVDYDARSISAFVDHEKFNHPAVPRGRSVTWTALAEGAQVEWKCTSDVPAKFLPAACR